MSSRKVQVSSWALIIFSILTLPNCFSLVPSALANIFYSREDINEEIKQLEEKTLNKSNQDAQDKIELLKNSKSIVQPRKTAIITFLISTILMIALIIIISKSLRNIS